MGGHETRMRGTWNTFVRRSRNIARNSQWRKARQRHTQAMTFSGIFSRTISAPPSFNDADPAKPRRLPGFEIAEPHGYLFSHFLHKGNKLLVYPLRAHPEAGPRDADTGYNAPRVVPDRCPHGASLLLVFPGGQGVPGLIYLGKLLLKLGKRGDRPFCVSGEGPAPKQPINLILRLEGTGPYRSRCSELAAAFRRER